MRAPWSLIIIAPTRLEPPPLPLEPGPAHHGSYEDKKLLLLFEANQQM